MSTETFNSEHPQENTQEDENVVSSPHEYCSSMDASYSIIHILREISSPESPASIADIQKSMTPRRAKHPAQTPSGPTVERLLNPGKSKKSNLHRIISNSLETHRKFLSPAHGRQNSDMQSVISTIDEMFAYKDLLAFQIMKGYWDKDQFHALPIAFEDDLSTQKTLFYLSYRINPRLFHLVNYFHKPDLIDNFPYDSTYQHEVSARLQYMLDNMASYPYLTQDDADVLYDIFSHQYTLGEIPPHAPLPRNRETINFSLLAKLTTGFQICHKNKSIPNAPPGKISCMKITTGEYSCDKSGNLTFSYSRVYEGYPLSTLFHESKYYIAVAIPKRDMEFKYVYLRVDHIIDCCDMQTAPTYTLDDLGTPPPISEYLYGTSKSYYSVTDCSKSAFIDLIDLFGKDALSNCKIERALWSFTLAIPTSRSVQLKAILAPEQYKEFQPASQIDDRKTTLAFLNSIQSISKVTYPNNYPSTYRFSRELEDGKISSSAHRLISAIRSKDFGMLHCLLQKQKKIFSPVDAAWICHFALELDATIFEEILKFCPAPETFIFHVKCPAYNFLRYTTPFSESGLSLVTVAVFFDRLDIFKLLLNHGASLNNDREGYLSPLEVALAQNSQNCLRFLLNHPEVDKSLTSELLYLLARAGFDQKITPACKLAAPILLGCTCNDISNVLDDVVYTPFPSEITAEHIAAATNLPLLLQFCKLHPEELTDTDAELILSSFPFYPSASLHPDKLAFVFSIIAKACPSILHANQFRYLLAVAALQIKQGEKFSDELMWLLKEIPETEIVINYQGNLHTWLGQYGMLRRWDKVLNHPCFKRKEPLVPVIHRNTPPPCPKNAVSREVMDEVLNHLKITGDPSPDSLSILARYTLLYASPKLVLEQFQPGKLLATEHPSQLLIYINALEDTGTIKPQQKKEWLALLPPQ